jgi:hypothetical protein
VSLVASIIFFAAEVEQKVAERLFGVLHTDALVGGAHQFVAESRPRTAALGRLAGTGHQGPVAVGQQQSGGEGTDGGRVSNPPESSSSSCFASTIGVFVVVATTPSGRAKGGNFLEEEE